MSRYYDVRITVPEEYIDNAVQCAHTFWGRLYWRTDYWEAEVRPEIDAKPPHAARLTRDTIQRGLAWLATNGYSEAFGRIVNNEADSCDGDLLVQAAAFGEIVYA